MKRKKGSKILKVILLILLGLILLFALTIIIGRIINAQKYAIRSEAGVQKTDYITIGGIEQYIQIRGQDISNPIIVVLHGGPGNNMAYYSYYWQADLEHEYTIVHWDQRGCGNTYYRNKEAAKPTFDLLLSDLDELVDYVCAMYSQDGVIIMGHSWGTVLGGVYAYKHPEKVSAYVGVSQFTDVWKSEQYAAEEAAHLANTASKTDDAKKIEEQFQLMHSSPQLDMQELLTLRQLTGKYLPEGENTPVSAALFSPYMTFNDLRWYLSPMFSFDTFTGNQEKLYDALYAENGFSMYDYTQYEVPVVMIAGGSDWTTPYKMAQAYFDSISAPEKEFTLIENAGHIPFKPGKFTEALLNALNNIL